jgi:hypothetical protein
VAQVQLPRLARTAGVGHRERHSRGWAREPARTGHAVRESTASQGLARLVRVRMLLRLTSNPRW